MNPSNYLLRRQSGGASVEYLLIAALVIVVLINGDPSPLERFFDAMKTAYARFSHAMSLP
jgi:Flp pilus assembly pilin Flp